ncbi:PepSY domain-containing protein [Streptomyces sp. NPDC093252]|uniref:PepSY-associated TM helix domain-containing protein n=1 Tax=Streptomyces sp. NPDC093252 TaxID=3154980 RepID=UPI0034337AB9
MPLNTDPPGLSDPSDPPSPSDPSDPSEPSDPLGTGRTGGTALATAAQPGPSAPARRPAGLGALLARLHFYAGVMIAPFLLVAAVTGLLYTLTPQLDALVYDKELHVSREGDAVVPLSGQLAAARAAHPDGTLTAVRPGSGESTTQVDFALPELGEKAHTVYVDPYSGEVTGQLTTWFGYTPLMTWFDDLHRNLQLGDLGRHYSEVAASWLWVLVLGGLILWVRRRNGNRTARRLLLPDRAAKGVRRTRNWHAVTGVWLAVGLLGLSATGLTWSRYAGAHFGEALDALRSGTPGVSTALPGAPADAGDDGHGSHGSHGAGDSGEGVDPAAVDGVLRTAREAGLDGPISIAVPSDATTAWTVAETRDRWPVGRDTLAVDASTGTVVDRVDFADWPFLARLSTWGISAHMGLLFGPVNQILLAIVAIGLISLIVWGYRMWWQRRPTRADRRTPLGAPPARGAWRGVPLPVLALGAVVTAALGWAIPLFGIPLAGFLAVDLAVGAARRRRSATTGSPGRAG